MSGGFISGLPLCNDVGQWDNVSKVTMKKDAKLRISREVLLREDFRVGLECHATREQARCVAECLASSTFMY